MPEVLMVIAPEVFRDEEYAVPKRVLEARGAKVTTASSRPGECIGKLGMTAQAETSISDAVGKAWDAVVFVGGGGAEIFFDDPDAHRLARDTASAGRIIAAICIAPSVLARAGLLQGFRATAFPTQRDDLVRHGAIWVDEQVVSDGRIVTASGPEAAQAFGETLAEKLAL